MDVHTLMRNSVVTGYYQLILLSILYRFLDPVVADATGREMMGSLCKIDRTFIKFNRGDMV